MLYDLVVTQPVKMIRNLDRWLDDAVAWAETRKFDPDTLLAARLAPDMFPLKRQLQSVADTAKLTAARVAGVTAPVHDDDETTLGQLRARLHSVVEFLESLDRSAIDGQEDRPIEIAFLGGRTARAEDYVRDFGIPNFYFHLVTAYGLLRHNGTVLGKATYIGGITLIDG